MPIIVRRRQNPSALSPCAPLTATTTTSRRRRSEEAARRLAPVITEIRKAGHHGNAEIAKCLNNQGLLAPSGGPFSRETVRRSAGYETVWFRGATTDAIGGLEGSAPQPASIRSEKVCGVEGAQKARASRMGHLNQNRTWFSVPKSSPGPRNTPEDRLVHVQL